MCFSANGPHQGQAAPGWVLATTTLWCEVDHKNLFIGRPVCVSGRPFCSCERAARGQVPLIERKPPLIGQVAPLGRSTPSRR